MHETITLWRFQDGFKHRRENFSYEGLEALFDYLEGLEEELGEPIEFDPIGICCEYSEYANAWEAMEQYQPEDMPTVDDSEGMDLLEISEAGEALALEWLQDMTQVITFQGGIIIQDF